LPDIKKTQAKIQGKYLGDITKEAFESRELIIVSLEKIGGAPEAEPSNVVSGLAQGTKSVV